MTRRLALVADQHELNCSVSAGQWLSIDQMRLRVLLVVTTAVGAILGESPLDSCLPSVTIQLLCQRQALSMHTKTLACSVSELLLLNGHHRSNVVTVLSTTFLLTWASFRFANIRVTTLLVLNSLLLQQVQCLCHCSLASSTEVFHSLLQMAHS